MIEKINTIKNPLTIIAIFAALSEVAGVTAIGLIDKSLQEIFVWFVIIFPTVLVILFFLTLNFNSKVLYAPSDFKDETNFISLLNKVDQVSSKIDHIFIKIKIVLKSDSRQYELPFELRLVDLRRSEMLGIIGTLPLKNHGRYQLDYLRTKEFMDQINKIRENNCDSIFIIPCTEKELLQFDINT